MSEEPETEEFVEFGGKFIKATDLAGLLEKLPSISNFSKEEKKEHKTKKNIELQKFNENYSVVMRGANVLIMREGINTENQSRELSFLNKEAFILYNQNKVFRWSMKPIFIAKEWLEWDGRRQYDNLVFRPNQPSEIKSPVDFGDAGLQYNLWRGFSFDPVEYTKEDNDKDIGCYYTFLDHLRINLCAENEEHYQWVLAWFADIFQRPERKNGMALIMRGKMGVGKGIIAKIIGALCSKHYMLISQRSQVTGKFNGHLADKILVFLDEPPWPGDKEAEGVLRSLITEPILAVEHKGKDTVTVDSYVRILMATNHDWAVPVGMDDERRMAVFDVQEKQRENKDYFKNMLAQLSAHDNSGYKALLHFFLNHKYDDKVLQKLPKTKALLEQKQLSLPRHVQFWMERLQTGNFEDGDSWPSEINVNTFYQSYITYCEQVREMRPIDKLGLTRRIKNKFCQSITMRNSNSRRFLVLPSLRLCREEFDTAIGQEIDWNENEQIAFDKL